MVGILRYIINALLILIPDFRELDFSCFRALFKHEFKGLNLQNFLLEKALLKLRPMGQVATAVHISILNNAPVALSRLLIAMKDHPPNNKAVISL